MKITIPNSCTIPSTGPFLDRCSRGVFIERHGVPDNLPVVMSEVEKVLDYNPKKCLILPEGLYSYVCPENLYIDRVVTEAGIEAEDPIVKPYTAEVAYIANETNRIAALAVLMSDVECVYGLEMLELNEMPDKDLEAWFELRVNALAISFDLRPHEIISDFDQLIHLKQLDELRFIERIRELSCVHHRLIDLSNEESKLKLLSILALRRQQKVLVISGIAHKPVFIGNET